MIWYPGHDDLTEWLALYRRVARAIGGEPDAGPPAAVLGPGGRIRQDRCVCQRLVLHQPAGQVWWGGLWADRLTKSSFGDRAVEFGFATRQDLDRLADAWRAWADCDDGWFLIPHGEVLCWPAG